MANEIVKAGIGEMAMDHWATQRLIEWASGKTGNEKTKEALRRDMDTFAAELAGPAPSPVERVLAETAAVSWFALRLAEAQWAGAATEGGLALVQSEHCQRRVDRAHRRLLATLKTLATVRRLGVPAIQLNVARHQLNVASPSKP